MPTSPVDAHTYWSELRDLVNTRRCWLRVAYTMDDVTEIGRWGQTLGIPVANYLEGPSGPMRFADVLWVEVSTQRLCGGLAGRPLESIDIREDLIAAMSKTQLIWDVRRTTWSIDRLFADKAIDVVHVDAPPLTVS